VNKMKAEWRYFLPAQVFHLRNYPVGFCAIWYRERDLRNWF